MLMEIISLFIKGFIVTLGGLTAVGLCNASSTVAKENIRNERD